MEGAIEEVELTNLDENFSAALCKLVSREGGMNLGIESKLNSSG
jgi:hypothetical protein